MAEFNVNQAIGEALRTVRLEQGKTQTEVADSTGYTQEQISKWEHGHRTPEIKSLYGLATYYEKPISKFLPEIEEAKQFIKEEEGSE